MRESRTPGAVRGGPGKPGSLPRHTYLDKVVESVAQDPERIAVVHSILKTMVDAGTNTRTFIALDEFRRNLPDVNESEILRFIEKLLEARVVEERSARYSLSHEHMVGKVKEWFDPRELERKRAEETLGRGMAEWKNSAALLGRVQVGRIRKWLPEPTADEQALLLASEQKYLEDERREAGWRRLKRLSLYGAGAFTALVIFLGVYSWVQKLGAERATALAVSRQWAAQAHTDLDLHAPRDLLLALNSVALARRIGAFNPIEARQLLDDVLNSAGGLPLHHSGPVTAIGLSPDGQSLAAASGGDIRIWDMAAPARPARVLGTPGKVAALAFRPDGHTLATVGDDAILRLWPMEAADPAAAVRLLQRHGGPIANVAYSPSGRWIATVSMDGTARLWDPSSTDPAATSIVLPHEELASVRTLAFSPDEHWLATASWHDRNGGMLRLWDLRSSDPAERSARIPVDAGTDIHSLAFSPNSEWLAAGATETYKVLLLRVAAPDTRFSMHVDQWVERLAFSPDGHWLAAPSHYTALLWDLTKADPSEAPLVLRGHKDQIADLAFAPDGSLFATASWDRTVQVWDVADRFTLSAVLRGHEGPLSGLSFSSDARHVATASEDGNVRLWDVSSPAAEPLILGANKGINNLHMWNVRSAGSHIAPRLLQDQLDPFAGTVFSPDGKWLATVSRRGTFIHLWNVAAPTPKRYDLPIRNDYLVTPDFSFDGRWRATPAADGVGIVLWNLQQPNPIANGKLLRGHRNVVRSLAFSADGHRLISGANDGLAIVWDVTAENPSANPRRLSGANSLVRSVAISGDGRWAIAGSWEPDPVARIWDLSAAATSEPIVLPFHDRVYDVAVSPDGHWAAAASWDHTSQVIDLTTPGAKPIVLRGHTARTLSVAFSPDSRWLATGNEDRTARLWDLTAADPAADSVILRSEGEVGNVAFSPDGHWLALGGTEIRARPFSPDSVWFASNDADARLYHPRLQDLTELACQTAGRNLLQNEIRSSEVPLDRVICSK